MSRRRTVLGLAALLAVGGASCTPLPSRSAAPTSTASTLESQDFKLVNTFRSRNGVAVLRYSNELDAKAGKQAASMAAAGKIFHSASLSSGVSPGWSLIGENVAVAGSVDQAQAMLEKSAPHRANLLERRFVEIGVGVVQKGGTFYVAQVFVQR